MTRERALSVVVAQRAGAGAYGGAAAQANHLFGRRQDHSFRRAPHGDVLHPDGRGAGGVPHASANLPHAGASNLTPGKGKGPGGGR